MTPGLALGRRDRACSRWSAGVLATRVGQSIPSSARRSSSSMPRWWASSWRIVIRTSSARSSGSGKSSSSGRRNSDDPVRDRRPSPRPTRRAARPRTGRTASRRARGRSRAAARASGSSAMTIATSSSAAAERRRDAGDRAVDEAVEAFVARRGAAVRPRPGAASALRHGARILAAMTGAPTALGVEPGRPTRDARPRSGAEPDGFVVVADGDSDPLPRLGRPGRRCRPRARRPARPRPAPARMVVGAGRAAARGGRRHRRRGPARPGPVRRADGRLRPATLAADAVAVAEGSGLLGAGGAGRRSPATGSGRSSRRRRPRALGDRCAGLVLVDGGWERLEVATGLDVDEFLRGLDEPPEVLRSMGAYLADRRGVRPGDLGRRPGARRPGRGRRDARRATSSRGPAARRRGDRRTMFAYDPAPVAGRGRGAGDGAGRAADRTTTARASRSCAGRRRRARRAGRAPIRVAGFPARRPQPHALPPGRGRRGDPRRSPGRRPTRIGRSLGSDARRLHAGPSRPRHHAPRRSWASQVPANEVAERAERIRATLEADGGFELAGADRARRGADHRRPRPGPRSRFLREAWPEAPRPGIASDFLAPETYPEPRDVRGHVRGRRVPPRAGARRRAGRVLGARHRRRPIVAGTYAAARGRRRRRPDDRRPRARRRAAAYGLCRPPGHHAARSMYGGYCFFNNAAIAAEAIVRADRRARRDPRRRLPPRQRHPADLLAPRRRPVRLAPRRPGPRSTRTSSAGPTRPARARGRARTSTCRCRPARRTRRTWPRSTAALERDRRPRRARSSSCRSASTPTASTRSATSR